MISQYRLPGLLPGEKIIKIVRRSLFVFFLRVLFLAGLAIVPLAFGFFLVMSYPALLEDISYYALIVLGASAYYLFVWLFSFFSFIDYYLDFFVITNERIINIKQDGFFARSISEQHIERVQDVTSEVEGFFQTIFKYGNIYVQTAAEQEKIFFHEISHPDLVRDLIVKAADEKRGLKTGV